MPINFAKFTNRSPSGSLKLHAPLSERTHRARRHLRPIQIAYRGSQAVGKAAVFIPGMVVPAGGWSPLFLGMVGGLTVLVVLPSKLTRRNKAHLG